MKVIQKVKKLLKSISEGATSQVAVKEDACGGIASKALLGHGVASARRHGRGAPSTSLVSSGESSKCLAGDSHNTYSANSNYVLRHGLFLSLYSLIKKASGKLPWRSRTNHNSDSTSSSSSSSSSYSRSSVSTSACGFNTTRNYIKNFRRIRILGSASLFSLGLLLLATFVPLYNVTRTEDTEAAAGTAKDSSITFTATRSTASVDLTVTSENGTFASSTSSNQAAFSLSTTNYTGYTLTIASNTNTSELTNTNGGSLSSISSSIDESTFNTSTYNNQWGYKPNYYGSSANSNYRPSPTTTATTLDATTTANTTAKNYTIALGARADYTNASGTYSSSNYKLMYVANPVAYNITYADNSGDSTVANIPAVQSSDSVTTSTIVLTSATPTRTGYSFKSWCLGTVSNSGTSCSGTEYNSGASFGIDRTANKASNTATLTAVWTANKYTCTKQYRLQNADGSWGNYTTDTTEQVAYNSTCSYSKTVTNYKGSENGTNGSAAINSATMNSTSGITVQVSLYRNTFTCSKRYRLQNADGNYPSSYTSVTGETIRYGATCSYSQSYTNYQTGSTSATITAATTLSLDLPRNTYTLTVTAGSNTSSATGGGTYRWGQTVTVGVTKASNTTCISYAAPTWSRTSGSGTLNATSGTSVTFTMTTSNATVTATSSSTRKTYTISYNANGGTGTTSSTTGNCGANSTLAANGFSRTNYSFLGWSTSDTATTASYNAGTAYNLGERTSNLTLYAVWKDNRTYMQDMKKSDCTTTAKTVYDNRDGEAYLVQKLADGNCWMLDNLRLGGTSAISLTTANTNSNGNFTLPAGITSGFNSYTAAQINVASKNTTTTGYGSGSQKIGVYYNYCAASAGTICSSSNPSNASYDICPKGWRMPTGNSSGEYQALYAAYSSNVTNFRNALSTPLSGRFLNSSADRQGSVGFFWSSTYVSSITVALLQVDSSVYPVTGGPLYYGYSVRCIKKPDNIGYMQNATASTLTSAAPNVGDIVEMTDSRDGKNYLIGKLADGKYWMTSNLDLTGGITLTSSDSNVTSSYTLPSSSSSPNFSSDTTATVYNSGSTNCSASKGCYSYYSYLAATAGTGSSVSMNGYNASGSICPKGWRLPTATTSNANAQTNNNWKTGDFYALAKAYGANLESGYSQSSNAFYTNAGPGTTPNFLLSGYFNSTSFNNGGSYGLYWSSTAYDSSYAYYLMFGSGIVNSANYNNRRLGLAVRCVYAG